MNPLLHHSTAVQNEFYATELNNQGTRYLHGRDFRSAIACFSESLQYCRRVIRKDINITNTNMTSSSSSSSQITLNGLMAETGPSSSMAMKGGSGRRFIYESPIEIPSALSISSYADCNIHVLLSISTLFNMALAHQLMAEQSPPHHGGSNSGNKGCDSISQTYRRSLLQKAIRLYQLGYDFLGQNSEQPIASCELLMLAITNNLAVAYQSMGDTQPADRLFQHLVSLLRLFMYYGMNEDHPITFHCFFANSAHVEEKYYSPPTAGAA